MAVPGNEELQAILGMMELEREQAISTAKQLSYLFNIHVVRMCDLGYPISYLHLYAVFFLFLPDFFS